HVLAGDVAVGFRVHLALDRHDRRMHERAASAQLRAPAHIVDDLPLLRARHLTLLRCPVRRWGPTRRSERPDPPRSSPRATSARGGAPPRAPSANSDLPSSSTAPGASARPARTALGAESPSSADAPPRSCTA